MREANTYDLVILDLCGPDCFCTGIQELFIVPTVFLTTGAISKISKIPLSSIQRSL